MSSMNNLTKTQVSNSHQSEKEVKEDEHVSYAMQLAQSICLPMVLYTAMKLKLFEIIAGAGEGEKLSPTQIASQLPTKNPDAASLIDRMLLLLSSYSVITYDVVEVDGGDEVGCKRFYGLSPVGKYFVENQEGGSVGPMLEMLQEKVFIDSWYELGNAVLEGGIPFNRMHGVNVFEYVSRDSRMNELFNKAMAGPTAMLLKMVLDEYKGFQHLQTLVDVGGSVGVTLQKITSKYPSIKGINFDLPHVIKEDRYIRRVEHIGGDMFESVPGGDAILMKMILHDWSDDHCLKLLRNCFNALPDNGKVIVVDFVLPAKLDTSSSSKCVCQSDMLMMTQNPGGKERSENEVRALAVAAGFRDLRLECLAGNVGVIEIYK